MTERVLLRLLKIHNHDQTWYHLRVTNSSTAGHDRRHPSMPLLWHSVMALHSWINSIISRLLVSLFSEMGIESDREEGPVMSDALLDYW